MDTGSCELGLGHGMRFAKHIEPNNVAHISSDVVGLE